jgi:hypothetical protein
MCNNGLRASVFIGEGLAQKLIHLFVKAMVDLHSWVSIFFRLPVRPSSPAKGRKTVSIVRQTLFQVFVQIHQGLFHMETVAFFRCWILNCLFFKAKILQFDNEITIGKEAIGPIHLLYSGSPPSRLTVSPLRNHVNTLPPADHYRVSLDSRSCYLPFFPPVC